MRRLLALLASAAVLVATGSGPVAAQSAAGRYAQQAFNVTNAHRTHDGLRALRPSDCLKHAAVRQAKLMAERERIFHQDLDALLEDCRLDTAAENVAVGFPNGRSVVNDGWMRSEGHRANILDPRLRLMGIGARMGHNGRWYVAQVFGRRA